MEAVNENKIEVPAQPSQHSNVFPLLRHGNEYVPAINRIIQQGDIKHAEMIGGDDERPLFRQILPAADFHPRNEIYQPSQNPTQDVAHQPILHEQTDDLPAVPLLG